MGIQQTLHDRLGEGSPPAATHRSPTAPYAPVVDDAAEAPQKSWLGPAIASGVLGFLVGALFWHLIGFWGFVHDVVLKGPVVTRAAQQSGPACTELVYDRETRITRAVPCPQTAPLLAEVEKSREDFAGPTRSRWVRNSRWYVTVNTSEDDEEPVRQP